VRGALAEAEKLHHKEGVVASSLVSSEICIEVCAESVLGLMGGIHQLNVPELEGRIESLTIR